MSGPRFVYLHGFASSPGSAKARAFEAWGRSHGVAFDALDLRVPSFETLLFSAMKARVREALDRDGPRGRAVLVGSSLGGLLAARVAEEDPRVCGLFLMAPAFRLAERWRQRLGEAGWARWESEGSLEVDDYGTKTRSRVHYAFVDELARLDPGFPDVRIPTTIVHGVRDEVVGVDLSRTFHEQNPHVHLIEVDDGHDLGASIERILAEAKTFLRPYAALP